MKVRTKVVCTIGPAVSSYKKILELVDAGMSVARINFSHGTHKEHAKMIEYLKKAREEKKRPLAIMLDTHGPKIRIQELDEPLQLKPKDKLILTRKKSKKRGEVAIDPPEVLDVMHPGIEVLFDDGYIIAKVIERKEDKVVIEIENEGVLKSAKGVALPSTDVPLPALTKTDVEDLKFACKQDVDLIAASFVRSAHHVLAVKELLAQEGKPDIQVVAKIENAQGVENFDSIVQVSDGIMIARGDLGVELDLQKVPRLQKMMIRKCYQACKPSVTATQMLESMIYYPRPTRAEVSDVANAIYDCTACVMLSGETAVGKYPVETVKRMRSIIIEAENDFDYREFFVQNSQKDYHDVSSAVSMAAVKTAYSANAKCIFAFTTSGGTARLVSRLRPPIPIVAVTPSKKHYHQLAFNWGVIPVLAEGCKNIKEAFRAACTFAFSHQLIAFGDMVVITAGAPFGKQGTTNLMRVENIGEVLVRGHQGYGPKVSGKVVFLMAPEMVEPEALEDRLVIIRHCDASFLPVLKKAKGVILQNYIGDGHSEKYLMLVAKTFEISVMSRADGAMSILKEGDEVTLDPQKGLVYKGSEENFNPSGLYL